MEARIRNHALLQCQRPMANTICQLSRRLPDDPLQRTKVRCNEGPLPYSGALVYTSHQLFGAPFV